MDRLFLELLGDCGVLRTYETNEIIHLDQIPPESVYLIHEGKVKHLVYDENGEEKTLLILKKGDIFGEVTYFQQDINAVVTQAISPCQIASIPVAEFERMLKEHPELYAEIVRLVTYKMRIVMSQVKDMAFQTVEGRLANLLLRLADQQGVQTEMGYVMIDFDVTHQELANMIAAYRSTVSRIMGRLCKHRVIEVVNKRIVILDYLGLQQMANSDCGNRQR
ncbi:MAG: Crp/Fnr family transcriptional regulator [Firmicutes bacterium]|nr:Crp/Fnr family transcriptional regulator [Bacillota bacterium]